MTSLQFLTLALLGSLVSMRGEAFTVGHSKFASSSRRCSSILDMSTGGGSECESSSSDDGVTSRRDVLRRSMGVAFSAVLGTTSMLGAPKNAEASYSAYANREKDWEERKKTGDVKFTSSRDLKKQLREMVPENSESSKIFCPNGQSSAVSPLMENKCGDLMAMPSVYGRTPDVVGNSIPGFTSSGDRYPTSQGGVGDSTQLSAGVGGFPSYSGTAGRR